MSDVNNFNQGEQQNNEFNQQPTNEYGQQPANDYSQQSFGYTGAPVVQEEKKGNGSPTKSIACAPHAASL